MYIGSGAWGRSEDCESSGEVSETGNRKKKKTVGTGIPRVSTVRGQEQEERRRCEVENRLVLGSREAVVERMWSEV